MLRRLTPLSFSAVKHRPFCIQGLPHSFLCPGSFLQQIPEFHTPNSHFSHKRFYATSKKDYYELLGVSRNASQDDIKKAYRKLAKQYHPDLNKGNKEYEKKFAEISAAYDVLGNDEKRRSYDQFGDDMMQGQYSGEPVDLSDLFDSFFRGNTANRVIRGRDIGVKLKLSFMEAIKGCEKEVNYTARQKCGTCEGSGMKPGTKASTCKSCKGKGVTRTARGPFQIETQCSACNGEGSVKTNPCTPCKGQGVVPQTIKTKVNIPAGVSDGDNVRNPGAGDASPDPKGKSGDMIISLEVEPHDVFDRKDFDLHVYVPIGLAQALIGGYIKVPTLKGDVEVQIPAGAQPHELRVMKGAGVRNPENPSQVGNQFIHFEIQLPKTLTPKQKELLLEFQKDEKPAPPISSTSSYAKSKGSSQSTSSDGSSNWFERVRSYMK